MPDHHSSSFDMKGFPVSSSVFAGTKIVVIITVWMIMTSCRSGSTDPSAEGMVLIPAGEFIMGSDKEDTEGIAKETGMIRPLYKDEHPERRSFLPDYYIDRFEVTNGLYAQFIQATGHNPPPHWGAAGFPPDRTEYPVSFVSWDDAQEYCRWRGGRLPTEPEWEKAARGSAGLEYPWGNQFEEGHANTGDSGHNDTVPVGSFISGTSPYGVHDLVGNVGEWVADWYRPYEGNSLKSPLFGERLKVIRGGSWGGSGGHYALDLFYRTAHRLFGEPEGLYPDIGMRCVKAG